MQHRRMLVALFGATLFAAGCGSDEPKGNIFEQKPECMGADVDPLTGEHHMVISTLEIGSDMDGFDLDGDGEPDNKLSAIGTIARGAIQDAFEDFSIIIPLEFFDYPQNGPDECVKFAFYLGQYMFDDDQDGEKTADRGGDCNDHDAMIGPGMPEVPDNLKDDNCNGLADETQETQNTDAGSSVVIVPTTNDVDADGDGVSPADGDCDDTQATVRGPTVDEVCGDGLDNDCDGSADWGRDALGVMDCTPYDEGSPDTLRLDPLSFMMSGDPVIEFNSATTSMTSLGLTLHAGPSLFSVSIPLTDGINLELRISGATIEAQMLMNSDGLMIQGGRLGGVLDANTLDRVRGLEVDEIGLSPEDSLMDAMFANPTLGVILNLEKNDDDCSMPDVDVDRDGMEAFCDSNPLDEIYTVDKCIDGDGTVYLDGEGGVEHCTQVLNADGTFKFVDGVSVELNFETVPATLEL